MFSQFTLISNGFFSCEGCTTLLLFNEIEHNRKPVNLALPKDWVLHASSLFVCLSSLESVGKYLPELAILAWLFATVFLWAASSKHH